MGRRQPRRARGLHRQGERRLNGAPLPFEDSRRITGPHLLLAGPGAALDALGPAAQQEAALARWAANVRQAAAALGWPPPAMAQRRHASGCSLAIAAAEDQLFTATEVNEWAWCSACGDSGFHGPGHPVARDADEALETLRHFSAAEQRPALMALLDAARGRGMPALLDDEALSLGLGNRGRTWPLAALPTLDAVPWHTLGRIPTAMVTGSNGKTTTVRLLAAMLRAQGLRTGHSCTDGLFIGSEALDSGDYSGPAGARTILRDLRVEAAVLETARGGMLRRGLALDATDVAVITNISADHFGEYGIHTLEDLAAAKLTLARAVAPGGRLVLNADDPLLRHAGPAHDRVDWFTLDLAAARQRVAVREDTRLCGIDDGHLALDAGGATEPLLPITEITIAMGGDARHNLVNAAAAALAAVALGVPQVLIAGVLRDFGRRHSDNPGRLQRWAVGGIEVLLDYAHNPDGLDQLLRIAQARRQAGRLALLLGQAGNRDDAQIRALAGVAAQHRPDLVVLKDLDGYLRGRAAGEVAQLLRGVLRDAGLPPEALPVHLRELEAARAALAWARPGDVVVLPIHALTAKQAVGELLDGLQARGWRAGDPLP